MSSCSPARAYGAACGAFSILSLHFTARSTTVVGVRSEVASLTNKYHPQSVTSMDPTSSLSELFTDLSVGDQNAPHEPTTSLTRVSPDRDRFIDDDHKLLDAKLMKSSSTFRRFNEEPDLPALLSVITLGDKRLVTLAYEEAQELLTSPSSIKLVLQKEGSFKEVRQLSEFSAATQPLFEPLIIIEDVL